MVDRGQRENEAHRCRRPIKATAPSRRRQRNNSMTSIRSLSLFRHKCSKRKAAQFPRLNFNSNTRDDDDKAKTPLYLHIGPSGDCWTGSSIFAAKHLQPDYVKSVLLPEEGVCVDTLVAVLEENAKLAQEIYDTGKLPKQLLDEVGIITGEKEEDGK
jgi:hypothetical protein